MRLLINTAYPDFEFSIRSNEIEKQSEDYENCYKSCKQRLHKTLIALIIGARTKYLRKTEYLQCCMEAMTDSKELNPYDSAAIQEIINLLNDKVTEF